MSRAETYNEKNGRPSTRHHPPLLLIRRIVLSRQRSEQRDEHDSENEEDSGYSPGLKRNERGSAAKGGKRERSEWTKRTRTQLDFLSSPEVLLQSR